MRRLGAGIFFIMIGLLLTIPTIVKHLSLKQNCTGYLKQAADASTIENCIERLDKAIEYIEAQEWTSGYTSVIYKTEDENVGFWYDNLKDCQRILMDNKDAESLVQSNVLMRVRECLTDNEEQGTQLTIPNGLCYHPNNGAWAFYRFMIVLLIIGGLIFIICDEDI